MDLALITGASSGLGVQYAHQLAARGTSLVLVARREALLKELAAQLRQRYSVQVWPMVYDLSVPGSVKQLFQQCVDLKMDFTILINNAGIGKYGYFFDFPIEDQLATLQVNATVPTELTYYFLEHMRKHQKPSYLHYVASIAAFQPTGNFTVYSATKAYLRSFVETLAFECRGSSVAISCTCPGGTYTEFMKQSGQQITSSGHRFMMQPEDVVKRSLKAMFRGQVVYIPGILNQIACFLPRLLPRRLSLYLALRTMNQTVTQVRSQ